MPPTMNVNVPAVGATFVLVNREQLRRRKQAKMMVTTPYLVEQKVAVPTPPDKFDWGKAGATQFPVLGNDRYGDCYYTACAHGSQCWTGFAGPQWQPDVQQLIQRYLRISGGDNGLSDSDMMPEWLKGIVGPNGPRRILDEMTVNVSDTAGIWLAMWAFGGLIYTAALLDSWLRNPQPGSTWTNDGRPNQNAGHAMWLSGRLTGDQMQLETWGFRPPVKLTLAGMRASDPELIVAFSLDQFTDRGRCVFTGMSYEEKAALWLQLGGAALPPSPFGPPGPQPIPPSSAQRIEIFSDLKKGKYTVIDVASRDQLVDLATQLLASLGGLEAATAPPELLTAGPTPRLDYGKLFQIMLLLLSAINSGPMTPEKLQALIAAIMAILSRP